MPRARVRGAAGFSSTTFESCEIRKQKRGRLSFHSKKRLVQPRSSEHIAVMSRLHNRILRRSLLPAAVCLLSAACENDIPTGASRGSIDLAAKPSGDPVVTAADPSTAPQDTTLDVAVTGSGFDHGSRVDFGLDGVTTEKVRTNSTTFVSPKKVVANITIAADAIPDRYDVIVTTSKGKRGIGIERFEVTLRQGRSNLYTLTFGGDLMGTVSGLTLDSRDPLKAINAGAVSFRPVLASGERSACRRINGTSVTATDWGAFSNSSWRGGMDLARRGSGSFHFQIVGDQEDPDGGQINLVVNHEPVTDTVNLATGIAFADFRNARAQVGLTSWAETDANGAAVPDSEDRCINFTITAIPSGAASQ
ncbi:MAG TPA: hypothetical protein VFH11_00845 [Gemmatimonadota bacterium]|nr:hypothetical protein [Gemmatimonadota bacterium]